jgi:hypothetical protein
MKTSSGTGPDGPPSRTVPPGIRARFEAILGRALPDPLPLDRTVTVYHEVAGSSAQEQTARGVYQVRAGYDGTYFLDRYHEVQSPSFFSVHRRIREDGSQDNLETLETAGYFPDAADARREEARVAEHNTRVLKTLRAKGFG